MIPKLVSCTRSTMRDLCLRKASQGGIPPISSHDMRDTFISLGVKIGYSVDDMMLLTSHKQSKVVRAYVHRDAKDLVEIATKVSDRMAELLGV